MVYREMFKDLIKEIAKKDTEDRDFYFDFLNEKIKKFPNYVSSVFNYVFEGDILSERRHSGDLSVDQYQYKMISLDDKRRVAHNSAIDACAQINRICDQLALPHICPEKDVTREQVADFCVAITTEFFMEGTNKDLDTIDKVITALEHNDVKIKDVNITDEYKEGLALE